MEVRRTRKTLRDDARSDGLTILVNELTVCLVGEDQLSESRDHKGIDNPKENGSSDCHQNRCNEILLHGNVLYASPICVIRMSIILIPMKGTMIPPTP